MRLSTAQAAQLERLADGGSLPKSRISKELLLPLQEAGVVRLEKSGSSYLVRGIPGKLRSFAEHHWGIRDLGRYAASTPDNRSRASLAQIAGDSKALSNRPMEGIYVRLFAKAFLRGVPLSATPPGSALFIATKELPHLQILATTIIGIENPACLLDFEKSLRHFPEIRLDSSVLILRWSWGTRWKEWLQNWKGNLLHFPDYDPAGLRIFSAEVLANRPDARLLIPSQLETFLHERGDRELFLRQEAMLSALPDHIDILSVKEQITGMRKALEQESLLY